MQVPQRVDVTRLEIDQVVAAFYAVARADPTLGPVFESHVDDWPAHEAKIAAFWRNALLYERSYAGNPMQKHLAAGNVRSSHFEIWLHHFDAVLHDQLPENKALVWSALAHRIGQGLRFGIEEYDRGDNVPNLLASS